MQHITVQTDRQTCLFKTDSTGSPDCLPTLEHVCLYFFSFLFFHFLVVGSFSAHAFSPLMLLVGRKEGHLACS